MNRIDRKRHNAYHGKSWRLKKKRRKKLSRVNNKLNKSAFWIAPIAVLLLFMSCTSHKHHEPEWQGSIVTSNGVKEIRNPAAPMFGELQLSLAEELRIGEDNQQDYSFHRTKDIALDDHGNIYVLDMGNFRIQKFDRSGNYLMTIGRFGQGPGEFQVPAKIAVDRATGNIHVRDLTAGIVTFSANGEYLNTSRPTQMVRDFIPLNQERGFLAVIQKESESQLTYGVSLCHLSVNGQVGKTYAEYPYNVHTKELGTGVLYVETGYEFSIHIAQLDQETFLYGYSKDYVLHVFGFKGQVLFLIQKDAPIPSFSANEIESLKKFGVPARKPHFFSILVDSEGRIYVQRNKAEKLIRQYGWIDLESKEVDVFSKEGIFLLTTKLPPNTCVIKDGYLYSYSLDMEKGTEYVIKYKIINWADIKNGTLFCAIS